MKLDRESRLRGRDGGGCRLNRPYCLRGRRNRDGASPGLALLPHRKCTKIWEMATLESLRAQRAAILRIAAKYGATNVRVFGSVARGEAGPDSDVDLLVDFEPGRSLLDHAGLVIELEKLLERKVEVGTAKGLNSRHRERILREAVAL